MPREWRIRIEDMLACISAIQSYTRGMDIAQFFENQMLREAVERNFITIGEAACHVPDDIANRHADIPWADLRGMRHAMVREYSGIDLRIVWSTIGDDLTPLVEQLKRLLEAEN
jgi:uncharacterized protein with HEPN domain